MISATFAHGTMRHHDKSQALQLPDPAAYLPKPGSVPSATPGNPRGVGVAAASGDAVAPASPRSKSASPTSTAAVPLPAPQLPRTVSGHRNNPVATRGRDAINDIARRTAPTMPKVSSFEDFENNFL